MSEDAVTRAKSLAVVTWGWLAVLGVLTVGFGAVALLAPALTIALLAVAVALWLLVSGVGRLGLGFAMGGWPLWRRALTAAVGLVLTVAGFTALLNVGGSTVVLAYAVGLAFGLAGLADLSAAALAHRSRGRWVLLALGIVNLVVGAVFLLRPSAGLAAIAVTLGVTLVVLGVAQVVGALALRRAVHRTIDRAAAAGQPLTGPRPDDPNVIRGEVL